jgi:ADP-glucose pyrophosphorylase
VVHNSIFDEGAHVIHMVVEGSLLGRNVEIQGQSMRLNLGDQSWAMG